MNVITMEMRKAENNAQSLGISHNLYPNSANSGLNQNFQIWAAERFCETLCTIQSLEVCNIVVQLVYIAIKIKLHPRQTFYAVFTYKIWLRPNFCSSAKKKSNAWQPGWRLPSSENCLTG